MTEHRTCAVPGCGEPVQRRPGEKLSKWRERKTCSEPCRVKMRRFVKTGSAEKPVEPLRICALPGCDNPLVRRPTEGNAQWAARKCCSKKCAQRLSPAGVAATRIGHPRLRAAGKERPIAALLRCTNCGVEIPKPDGVSWGKYRGRSTCGSDECKTATSRKAVSAPKEREMSPLRAMLHIARPSVAQLRAYREATPDERRLFSRHIAAVAESMLNRGAPCT